MELGYLGDDYGILRGASTVINATKFKPDWRAYGLLRDSCIFSLCQHRPWSSSGSLDIKLPANMPDFLIHMGNPVQPHHLARPVE